MSFTAQIATSASKNNYHCFVSGTNTSDVGGFLQLQHWWVNTCCKVLNLGLWKLWKRNCSHHVLTTKSTPPMVTKDKWDTKEDPGECIVCTAGWQKAPLRLKQCWTAKSQARSLSHCWFMRVWRHQASNIMNHTSGS